MLADRGVTEPATATSSRCKGVDIDVNAGRDRHADRRQRRRQVHADDDDLRQPRAARAHPVRRAADITSCRPTRSRDGHRAVAGRAAHLPAHDGSGEPADGRPIAKRAQLSRRISSASSRCSRVLKERSDQRGGTLSGGEQQMLAIARRADGPAAAAAARRALARPRAAHRQADLRDDPGAQPQRGPDRVFLVEQNAYHALQLAHRGYVMVNGRSPCPGTGRELLESEEVRPPISKAARKRPGEGSRGDLLSDDGLRVFLVLTVIIGGGAAFLSGRGLARIVEAVLADFFLYGAARRCDALLPLRPVRRHADLSLYYSSSPMRAAHRCLARLRAMRTTQMVTQYRWLYERTSPLDLAQPARLKQSWRLRFRRNCCRLCATSQQGGDNATNDRAAHRFGRNFAARLRRRRRQHHHAGRGGRPDDRSIRLLRRADEERRPKWPSRTSTPPAACSARSSTSPSATTPAIRNRPVAVANQMSARARSFVAGHYCSGSSIPASQVYAEATSVQISPASTNPTFTDDRAGPNIYRVCGRDDSKAASPATISPSISPTRTSPSSTTRPPMARASPTRPRRR